MKNVGIPANFTIGGFVTPMNPELVASSGFCASDDEEGEPILYGESLSDILIQQFREDR